MTLLKNQWVIVTGGARRVGREFCLAIARAGGNVIIHHSNSPQLAEETASYVRQTGTKSLVVQADFSKPDEIERLIEDLSRMGEIYALVNNAAIFEPVFYHDTTREIWQRHLDINLYAPFRLSQAFAASLHRTGPGCIVNILDWRALRPSDDHFPYTISKAALVALTKSLAVALAPAITVNGIALGAILPPADGSPAEKVVQQTPSRRWATMQEVGDMLIFLLTSATYTTGEVIHLDGGRNLI